MHTRLSRFLIAVAAISTIGARAAAGQTQSSSAGGTLDLSNDPMPALHLSEIELLHRMSDANILGHIATIDSLEMMLSEQARAQSKSDVVLAYANEMDASYRNVLHRDRELGQQTGVGLTTMVGDLGRSHLGPAIDSVAVASDLNLDRLYILSQIQLHQHELAEFQTLQSVAKNPAIQQHIAAQIPIIYEQLTKARAIARSKGYGAPK